MQCQRPARQLESNGNPGANSAPKADSDAAFDATFDVSRGGHGGDTVAAQDTALGSAAVYPSHSSQRPRRHHDRPLPAFELEASMTTRMKHPAIGFGGAPGGPAAVGRPPRACKPAFPGLPVGPPGVTVDPAGRRRSESVGLPRGRRRLRSPSRP